MPGGGALRIGGAVCETDLPPFTRTVHTDHSSYSPCTDSLRVTQFPSRLPVFPRSVCGFPFLCFLLHVVTSCELIGDSEDVRAPTVTLVNSITSYWTNCVYSGVSFSCSTSYCVFVSPS